VGQTSRLRFALAPDTSGPLTLALDLVAVEREGYPSQRVAISVNGTALQTVTAMAGVPLAVELVIPGDVVAAHPDSLELVLDYPDAIAMSPSDSNTRMRSIKLLSARLASGTKQP